MLSLPYSNNGWLIRLDSAVGYGQQHQCFPSKKEVTLVCNTCISCSLVLAWSALFYVIVNRSLWSCLWKFAMVQNGISTILWNRIAMKVNKLCRTSWIGFGRISVRLRHPRNETLWNLRAAGCQHCWTFIRHSVSLSWTYFLGIPYFWECRLFWNYRISSIRHGSVSEIPILNRISELRRSLIVKC